MSYMAMTMTVTVTVTVTRGAKVGGVGVVATPLNFGRGVESPLIFRKICVEIIKIRLFYVKFLKVGHF